MTQAMPQTAIETAKAEVQAMSEVAGLAERIEHLLQHEHQNKSTALKKLTFNWIQLRCS